jgi:hypothetical protein
MKQTARAGKAKSSAAGGSQTSSSNATSSNDNTSTAAALSATAQSVAADAETLLKNDHRKVEQLFAKYEGLEEAEEKAECAKQICKELIVHAMLEEEIFYPACKEKNVESDMLDEAQVEHDGAKVMIHELLGQETEEKFYDAKVKVLSEYIKHHVGEEEKRSDGIFALARKAGVDMKAVGQKIQARKQQLLQEMEGDALPPPEFKSLQSIEGQNPSNQEDNMARYDDDRDDNGRFRSGGGRGGNRGGNGGRGSSGRERDEYGRFMSDNDDDRRYSSRGSEGGRGGSRYDDEDDDRRSLRGGNGGRGRDGENDGRGWYGDSEGHSRAARSRSGGGRDDDYDDRRSSRSSRDDDEDDRRSGRGGSSSRDRDEYGRFTSDDDRDYGRRSSGRSSRDDDDDDRRSSRGSSSSGGGRGRSSRDDDNDGRGWYGDSEGHSEAARLGWEHRGGGGGGRGRGGRDDDDDDRRSSRGSSGGRGQSQGGWFGDSRGHAEAARRGWRNRD